MEILPTYPKKFSMAEFFLQRRLEEGLGNNIAVIDGPSKWTYEEVHRKACQVGNVLRELGVEQENRILIIQNNTPEYVFSFWGTQYIGGVTTAAWPWIPAPKQDLYPYFLSYTKAKVAIIPFFLVQFFKELIDPSSKWYSEYPQHFCKAVLVTHIPEGHQNSLTDAFGVKFLPFNSIVSSAPDYLVGGAPIITKDDFAQWYFTSGTTDIPKGCVHLQHDTAYAADTYAKAVLKHTPEDRVSSLAPITGPYGTIFNLLFPFAVGAACCLTDVSSLNADKIFDFIRDSEITSLAMTPITIKMLIESKRKGDLRTVKHLISSGDVLPGVVYKQFSEKFGSVRILDAVGCSEMSNIYISNTMEGDILPGSVGVLVPGYETRIVDEDGKDVPTGEVGELWVKGDSTAVMYWNEHEKTKNTFQNDWYITGDMAYVTESGHYFLCGRKKDLLSLCDSKRALKISPYRVEDELLHFDEVKDCACVYVNPEEPVFTAFIVFKDGCGVEDELIASARSRLHDKIGENNAPGVYIATEQIPRNARGKIDRKALRKQRRDSKL